MLACLARMYSNILCVRISIKQVPQINHYTTHTHVCQNIREKVIFEFLCSYVLWDMTANTQTQITIAYWFCTFSLIVAPSSPVYVQGSYTTWIWVDTQVSCLYVHKELTALKWSNNMYHYRDSYYMHNYHYEHVVQWRSHTCSCNWNKCRYIGNTINWGHNMNKLLRQPSYALNSERTLLNWAPRLDPCQLVLD